MPVLSLDNGPAFLSIVVEWWRKGLGAETGLNTLHDRLRSWGGVGENIPQNVRFIEIFEVFCIYKQRNRIYIWSFYNIIEKSL